MKVRVDADVCTGCELCVSTAPEVFEMQGDKAVPISAEVEESLEDAAREGAQNCPVEAISIEE
jgi:ferredoxin